MITIYIENQPYTVEPGGRNLLAVCLSLGFDLPYFCWHPALHSVGACRQCAVKLFKDEHDANGRLIMSCMTPVKDGMRISIADPEAAAFRTSVIEWLMVNHPHDCPVCDEGGECHLQDMTVMTGHVRRRSRFAKRTHRSQDLGPFVHHEMNRCIQCYRCLRFYRDYAGGRDFDVLGWHDSVYFGRHADGALESEFSGNLVEVCPTGVFTDKTMQPQASRKWDLQCAPSLCPHCGLGCNTLPGERYGMLRRVLNRYHPDINGYFLCDRGRFGYGFVNSPRRIREPLLRGPDGSQPAVAGHGAEPVTDPNVIHGGLNPYLSGAECVNIPVDPETVTGSAPKKISRTPANSPQAVAPAVALARVANILRGGKIIGIGSPRSSLENNFALQQLVGPERYFHGVSDRELELLRQALALAQQGPIPLASLQDVEESDTAIVLGEDVTQTAPRLALALRQTVRHKPTEMAARLHIQPWDSFAVQIASQQTLGPCFVATTEQTKLDDIATATCRAAPDDVARLGFAVAHHLDAAAPAVPDLTPEMAAWARSAADSLQAGRQPVVVAGTSSGSLAQLQAAALVAQALQKAGRPAKLCLVVPEGNSMGAALFEGAGLDSALAKLRQGAADTVIILENDLHRRLPAAAADEILSAPHVVALDYLDTPTTAAAEVVLPAATLFESSGTLVNNEGRAQRFFQVFVPEGCISEGWRWLAALFPATGRTDKVPWQSLDEILAALSAAAPVFKAVQDAAPPADFRMDGQKIPRQSPRFSGRTAMNADRDIHEPQPPADPDTPLAYSMEGQPGQPPPALITRYLAPGWNSVQALNKFQDEVDGPWRGGAPGVRLLSSLPAATRPSPVSVPPPFAARGDEWLLVPQPHIYGSEELSCAAEAVAQRAPSRYVAVSQAEAARRGWKPGDELDVAIDGIHQRLPLQCSAQLPPGVAALPVGLTGCPALPLPAWGRITANGAPVGGASSPASSSSSAPQRSVPPGQKLGPQAGSASDAPEASA